MNLADTRAAEQAAISWTAGGGVRGALARYGVDFDDLRWWADAGRVACFNVGTDPTKFEGRFAGAIAAALIMGIELGRSGEIS